MIYLIEFVFQSKQDLNLNVINMITGIKNQKYEQDMYHANVKVNLMVENQNLNQKWNNNKCLCECKNPKEHVCEKDYTCNPSTCSCKNSRYTASFIEDSVIKHDEIMEETKTSNKF